MSPKQAPSAALARCVFFERRPVATTTFEFTAIRAFAAGTDLRDWLDTHTPPAIGDLVRLPESEQPETTWRVVDRQWTYPLVTGFDEYGIQTVGTCAVLTVIVVRTDMLFGAPAALAATKIDLDAA